MYLRTFDSIPQLAGAYSALAGQLSEARSAEQRIRDDEFEKVLTVLVGASPWQSFLRPNLDVARRNLPRRAFRVVDRKEFERTMRELGEGGDVGHIPGVTDKRNGVITMQEFFGVNSQATYLGAALHEAVHLVSHAPGRSGRRHSTAWGIVGEGLLEGIVECVTIDVLNAQQITLARPTMRGHVQRVPVAVALMRRFGLPLIGRLLFGGEFRPFLQLMNDTYTARGWQEIQTLTNANRPEQAIQRINQARAAQTQPVRNPAIANLRTR